MNIIDAHSHLNLNKEAPLNDLLVEMDNNHIDKSILILNLENEFNAFIHEYDLYCENKDRIGLACGLNFRNNKSAENLNYLLEKTGERIAIKIHPKLFKIKKEDISSVLESVKKYIGLPVIVDALYYGENIEYHIGVDLSIALAREYNDRKIIVAHSGSLDFLKCMMACRYMPHVFFDYSFIQSFFNRTSLRIDMVNFLQRTPNRVLFGSDRPYFPLNKTLLDFKDIAVESGITETQMVDIFYNNALNVYWDHN